MTGGSKSKSNDNSSSKAKAEEQIRLKGGNRGNGAGRGKAKDYQVSTLRRRNAPQFKYRLQSTLSYLENVVLRKFVNNMQQLVNVENWPKSDVCA